MVKRNKTALIILLISFLVTLAGCIEVVYEITIDKDDTEIIKLEINAPTPVAPYLKDIATELRNNEFAVETKYQGDRVIVTGTKRLMNGSWDIPTLPGYIKITKSNAFEFYMIDYILVKKYVLNVNYMYVRKRTTNPDGKDVDFFENIPLTFIVNYRGKIIETNATNWNKKSATWALNLKRFGNINTQLITYKINYPLVIAIIFVFLGILTLGLYLLVRLIKSKPKSTPPHPPLRELTGPKPHKSMTPPSITDGSED